MSYAVLEALHAPASAEALAQRLSVPVPHVRGELDRLARRGYVTQLDGAADAGLDCESVACAGCGFRAACGMAPEVRWARVPGHGKVAAPW